MSKETGLYLLRADEVLSSYKAVTGMGCMQNGICKTDPPWGFISAERPDNRKTADEGIG